MSRAEELANAKYPIVPLSIPETTPSGEILNSDKALDDFRISIQSFSSNHAFIEGYEQAEKDTREEIAKQLAKQWSDGYSEGYTKAEQDLMEKFKMWVAHNGYTAQESELVYNDFKQFITEN